jgi:hypothetical protein
MALAKKPPCDAPIWPPQTDDAPREQNIAIWRQRNMIALLGEMPERVQLFTVV